MFGEPLGVKFRNEALKARALADAEERAREWAYGIMLDKWKMDELRGRHETIVELYHWNEKRVKALEDELRALGKYP